MSHSEGTWSRIPSKLTPFCGQNLSEVSVWSGVFDKIPAVQSPCTNPIPLSVTPAWGTRRRESRTCRPSGVMLNFCKIRKVRACEICRVQEGSLCESAPTD